MNPYWGTDFFSFFAVLFSRILAAEWGAADEIQMTTLALVALSCGLIGPFLVLKRMAMFANSLSHTVLLGIALAFLCSSTLWGGELYDMSTLFLGALIAAFATAFFTEGLVRFFRLHQEASTGLVFTALFALGIIVVTLFMRNVHLGIEAVMGNADALQSSDCRGAFLLALLNICVIVFFYRPLQLICFDGNLAKTLGFRGNTLHFFLLFLTSLSCVGSFRAVGALLVLAFFVGPYLICRLFCHRLSRLLVFCPLVGSGISVVGVALARHILTTCDLALSTSGIIATLMGIFYLLAISFFSPSRNSQYSLTPSKRVSTK